MALLPTNPDEVTMPSSTSSSDPFWREMEDEPGAAKPKDAFIELIGGKFTVSIKDDSGKLLSKGTIQISTSGYTQSPTAAHRAAVRALVTELRKDLEKGIHWL